MKKNNAWNIRHLVHESQRPNEPAYYIEDCRILTDCIHLFDDGTKLKIPPKITTQ